ncbi:putative drug exporter of the RND superfamily [Jatrophihabitans endophyticus]|uniref:Putative drug exporter of the RND superfamily n=1 Tax=Jatrophihabitans endophyticus TaxID=1206085 RepID=A0A1M5SR58_9ACTN|nr:MMPL family transporter [Jatrophihabitans endophyticus]SHH41009.1 putative drug exporter of the RND superfamily [Jatrophihabitans endophyticus]
MSVRLYRLARWCFRRRWIVLGGWLAAVVAVVALAQLSGGKTTNTFTIPGTEAQQVVSVLQHKLPAASGATTQVVFAREDGDITDTADQAVVARTVQQLGRVPQVTTVTDPFRTHSVSPDKLLALATVYYDSAPGDVKTGTLDRLDPAVAAARDAGLRVEFTGTVYPQPTEAASPEAIGIVVALVILVLTFGSLVAGGLPIVTALFGVVISLMGFTALAALVDIATAATSVGTMLGISCGIDYALFILSRHRNHVLHGHDPQEAAGRAAGTAGSSVVFAGLSVVIALCGLAVVGIPFLTTMGLAAAGAVLVALLIALTLLPAALGFAGSRVARFSRLPLLRRAGPATRTAVTRPEDLRGTRYAAWVVRHRVPVLLVGVIALGALAIPVTSMELGLPGAGSRTTDDTSRRAYDLTTEHFGPGYNGTLTVVAQGVRDAAQVAPVATELGREDGVASATVSTVANGIALISVVPTTGPNDQATTDLVHRIRDDRTRIEGATGTHVLVGGATATDIDVSGKLGAALPVFLVVVAGLAFVLLTFAFRTVLVPLKSIVGFLLSVGAAFGAEVAVFQWGWLKGVFGVEPSQTLSFLPIILLAIIFGLSSDYEVFVVSRIKEHFTKHGDARQAVVLGTGQSARVVTAAALIMAAVFASFLLGHDPIIKSIGFSFAVGVLVDAFVVRLTLVPAVMAIVGERIWHHPAWFGRLVPDPDIEGERLDAALAREAAQGERSAETTAATSGVGRPG